MRKQWVSSRVSMRRPSRPFFPDTSLRLSLGRTAPACSGQCKSCLSSKHDHSRQYLKLPFLLCYVQVISDPQACALLARHLGQAAQPQTSLLMPQAAQRAPPALVAEVARADRVQDRWGRRLQVSP